VHEETHLRSGWIVRPCPVVEPRARLFCFPCAGGASHSFHSWRSRLPPGVELCAIELPGRGRRLRERACEGLTPLIEQIAEAISPSLETEFAFYGHSMGAIIAFELCRLLRRRSLPIPFLLMIAASRAPHLPRRGKRIHDSPDAEFIRSLRKLGGTPDEVLDDSDLMQLLLPALRGDFSIVETYQYRLEAPLPLPIAIFGGSDDKGISVSDLHDWKVQTSEHCSLKLFPGGHFFVASHEADLLDALRVELERYLSRTTHPVKTP
jgi:medium-chain acyl-[acyl-carrier-protein] hydrolase